ncbi:MAG TPA: DUF45 domain-containing protein [Rhodocyclaceae bacterium]|nr:DUF45 domain-containing protein [Rhodocyclaceae bacterium]HNH36506.1 DUF45 domain-containing protein [Rhodocyclaceae bacterium]
MRKRNPQLALRLDAPDPDPAVRWRDGTLLDFLGSQIRLCLDARVDGAGLAAGVLNLPLPPEATPRQVQDAAEAWLRREALRLFGEIAAREAARRNRPCPRLALSFAVRGGWVQVTGPSELRCNWRLIGQARPEIERALTLAVASLPREESVGDLFAPA